MLVDTTSSMSAANRSLFLRCFITSLAVAMASAVASPNCPSACVCGSSITCTDVGELPQMLMFPSLVYQSTFSSLSFTGRSKVRTIQSNALAGLPVVRLQLAGLGVRAVAAAAFSGIPGLLHIDLSANHVSGTVDRDILAVDAPLRSLDLSANDIDDVSADAFVIVRGTSFTDLRLADNRLADLPDTVFADMPGLRHLDVSGNLLTNLTQPLLSGLAELRTLRLGGNRISHVGAEAFHGLLNLQTLGLENNALSTLPDYVFDNLRQLVSLTLQGNRLASIAFDAFPSSPALATLRLDRNRFSDLRRIQGRVDGLRSLMTLSLAGNRLTSVPIDYFLGFGNLTHLDLSRNRIGGVLNASSFQGLEKLVMLMLSKNNIERLAAGTFGVLPSLHTLDLRKNGQLKRLEPGVFANCETLISLKLRGSGLVDVPPGVFQNISSLEELDLSGNAISKLYPGLFDELPSLMRLSLSTNYISALPEGMLVNTRQISTLELSGNTLNEAPLKAMDEFHSLFNLTMASNKLGKLSDLQSSTVTILNFTANYITEIANGAFNGTPAVRELYLNRNFLKALSADTFDRLERLRHLDLSENLVSVIAAGTFANLRSLSYLSLRGNQLSAVTPQMFRGMNVYTLDLSSNWLADGVEEAVATQAALNELILDDNRINAFNTSAIFGETVLRTVRLRRNRLTRLQDVRGTFFAGMRHLDVGENQFTDEIFASLNKASFLETLKLDGNRIGAVPAVGGLERSLMELDLANNSLTDDSLSELTRLSRLQRLRLDGNRISNLSTANWSLLATSLNELNVSSNRLTSLDEVNKLWSLTTLTADGNLIEAIPDRAFQPLYNLRVLSLRANSLTRIERSTLDGLEQSCRELDLSANRIASVDSQAFHRLKNLERLNLAGNAITELTLPPVMDQLEELRVDDNRLVSFPEGLVSFLSINTLSFSRNQQVSLPPIDIGNEFRASLVDFSDNRLQNIDAVRLVGTLNVVSFRGNALAEIGSGVLADATYIRELDISDNPLGRLPVSVTEAAARTARLSAANCSLWTLDDWAPDPAATTPTTQLVELLLPDNRLTAVPASFVRSVAGSLGHLNVRGNLLTTLNAEAFGSATELYRLSLAGNPWRCDCQLAWLRDRDVDLDNATCSAPASTVGQLVFCYNIDGCLASKPSLSAVVLPTICGSYSLPSTGPQVTDVKPLFGPKAGGTLLTVAGTQLTKSKSLLVLVASPFQHIASLPTNVVQSSISEAALSVETPASEETGRPLLVVVQFADGPAINTSLYFVYRPNPVVTDIHPLTHLLTGGTAVTVRGDGVNAAAEPVISVTVVVTRTSNLADERTMSNITQTYYSVSSERCSLINSTQLLCPMPAVPLPDDFDPSPNDTMHDDQRVPAAGSDALSLRGGPDLRDRADLYVGLRFDGYRGYVNLTATMPRLTFRFFATPTIDGSTRVIVFRPATQSTIDIAGRNLRRGSRESDYHVSIGHDGRCVVSSLHDNVLSCRPPPSEPRRSANDSFCHDLNAILVYVGYAGPYLYACIRYETTAPSTALIVGIAAAVGIVVVVAAAAVIAVVARRRCAAAKTPSRIGSGAARRDDQLEIIEEAPEGDATVNAECVNPAYFHQRRPQPPARRLRLLNAADNSALAAPVATAGDGYFEPIAGDEEEDDDVYVEPSTPLTATADDGYLVANDYERRAPPTVVESPIYIVPVPSPRWTETAAVRTTAPPPPATDPDYLTPLEDSRTADDEYQTLSARTGSPTGEAYTSLVATNPAAGKTDRVVAFQNQLSDDGYMRPYTEQPYELREIDLRTSIYEDVMPYL